MAGPEAVREAEWTVGASPHVRDGVSTARIMWSVSAALAPAGAWSVYLFGWAALYVIALCVVTCVLTEAVVQRARGRPITISDGSAVVTGLLLAYCLPSHSVAQGQLTLLKWQVPVFGGVVAIAIAKHCFGGLGQNIWNPALVGRAFVQLAFPAHVSLAQWPWPRGVDGLTRATALAKTGPVVDTVTQATAASAPAHTGYSVADLFVGNCPGSLGEVSALLLLIGAAYLIARRYVDWRLPVAYGVTLVAMATLLAWSPPTHTPPWVHDFARAFKAFREGHGSAGSFASGWLTFAGLELFAGGAVLGACFMATDMVTSPLSTRGQLLFGAGCGFLTALIRFYSGYPEGVCYAILLMNTVRPYVDRFSVRRVLGARAGGRA